MQVTVVMPGYVATSLSINAVLGDGSSYGKMDETTKAGFSPGFVAERALSAVAGCRKEEMIAKPMHQLAVKLKSIFPVLLDAIILRRYRKSLLADAKQ